MKSEELRTAETMNAPAGKSTGDAAQGETGTANVSANDTVAADSSLSILRSSSDYYQLGNKYRREGNWQEAINNYIAAIELDPNSPAVEAKRMLDDILGYYNKDMYNP